MVVQEGSLGRGLADGFDVPDQFFRVAGPVVELGQAQDSVRFKRLSVSRLRYFTTWETFFFKAKEKIIDLWGTHEFLDVGYRGTADLDDQVLGVPLGRVRPGLRDLLALLHRHRHSLAGRSVRWKRCWGLYKWVMGWCIVRLLRTYVPSTPVMFLDLR